MIELHTENDGQRYLRLCGALNYQHLSELDEALARIDFSGSQRLFVVADSTTTLDLSAVQLILQTIKSQGAPDLDLSQLNDADRRLFHLIDNALAKTDFTQSKKPRLRLFHDIGRIGYDILASILSILGLLGKLFFSVIEYRRKPRLFRIRELITQLDVCCVGALPVSLLVGGLVGVVVSYLFALQIGKYGANIFIVDGIALSMCRELSPILVAIVVAGRCGSAFTAQIGAMKLNQEIDALKIIGLSEIHVLVVPRALALIIAMPLLVFATDIIGIISGVVIAQTELSITPQLFIQRLAEVLTIKSPLIGFIKAPLFGLIIALIGCQQGLQVSGSTQSIGINTTKTVVHCIVAIIIINAIFAIALARLNL